jgi:hypothetical protein
LRKKIRKQTLPDADRLEKNWNGKKEGKKEEIERRKELSTTIKSLISTINFFHFLSGQKWWGMFGHA